MTAPKSYTYSTLGEGRYKKEEREGDRERTVIVPGSLKVFSSMRILHGCAYSRHTGYSFSLSLCLFTSVYSSFSLSLCLFPFVSITLSLYVSIPLSLVVLLCLSHSLSLSHPISLSLSLSLSLYLSISLSIIVLCSIIILCDFNLFAFTKLPKPRADLKSIF